MRFLIGSLILVLTLALSPPTQAGGKVEVAKQAARTIWQKIFNLKPSTGVRVRRSASTSKTAGKVEAEKEGIGTKLKNGAKELAGEIVSRKINTIQWGSNRKPIETRTEKDTDKNRRQADDLHKIRCVYLKGVARVREGCDKKAP